MIVETFTDFCRAAADYADHYPVGWRAGQATFNLLVRVRPDLAEMVRGSDFDPFYDDARLPLFYDFVARHWEV